VLQSRVESDALDLKVQVERALQVFSNGDKELSCARHAESNYSGTVGRRASREREGGDKQPEGGHQPQREP